MIATTKSSIAVRTALTCLTLFGASQTMAQTLTGTVTDRVGNGGYLANITFATGSTIYGAAGVIACIETGADFPSLPSVHTYQVVDVSKVVTNQTYAAKTEALVNWVVDTYYPSVLTWNIGGEDFNRVLWELARDHAGTAASLSGTVGTITGTTTTNADYFSMLSNMRYAYSSILSSYRSDSFSVHFLEDLATDKNYQNMVLITAVPEPSTYLMMFAGVGALMAWRRRSTR